MRWLNELEADAKRWAAKLTKIQKFEHSKTRKGQGDNLWMGTSRSHSFIQMIDRLPLLMIACGGSNFYNLTKRSNLVV
ncbi:MAG: hypothetical protein WA783_01225 [Phormidesmis sp.]